MKEEKRRKKELELRMSGQDTNSNHIKQDDTEDSDGEIKSSYYEKKVLTVIDVKKFYKYLTKPLTTSHLNTKIP
jgi:hypothetical protein